jgi:Ca-activated chloride channel family protein
MKQVIIILAILMQGMLLYAQQEKSLVKKGNDLYRQKKYKEAEVDYRKALDKKSQNLEGNFNLGDALYKQKQFDKAGEQFTKLAASNNNKQVAATAYHNLGNSLLENKKLEESIDAYKKSLLNNPADDQTRYNLAYAQEKLKQQQKQDKQNQQNKNQQNKDNKNQDKQNQQNKDNKDQDKKDQDKKDQDKQNQDKKQQQDQQKQQQNQLSKEDAQRMLDALNNDEKQTQEKLKNQKLKGTKLNISKDW